MPVPTSRQPGDYVEASDINAIATLANATEASVATKYTKPSLGIPEEDLDPDLLAKVNALPTGTLGYTSVRWTNVLEGPYEVPTDGTSDATDAIQEALDESLGVYIPPGDYAIAGTLLLNSNQHVIIAPGARLYRASNIAESVMFLNRTTGSGGYGGASNITIEGQGTLDAMRSTHSSDYGLIALGHVDGATIRDLTMTSIPTNWHHMELNAVRRGRVVNVHFTDQTANNGAMLQLDGMQTSGVFPFFGPYDLTPCNDITITGCRFSSGRRGIDTHSGHNNVPFPNIRIIDNHFQAMAQEAIYTLHYDGALIALNTFDDVEDGIRLTDRPSGQQVQSVTLMGNTFRDMRSGGTPILVEDAKADVIRMGNIADGVALESSIRGYGTVLPSASDIPAGQMFVLLDS